MIFDDGSTIDEVTGDSTPAPVGMLPQDVYDYQKMQPFTAGQQSAQPWWQNVIQYGITRAIDNRYGPPIMVAGNTATGSFAGQNGISYYQTPQGIRAGQPVQQQQQLLSGNNLLLLLGAGVAFLALKG